MALHPGEKGKSVTNQGATLRPVYPSVAGRKGVLRSLGIETPPGVNAKSPEGRRALGNPADQIVK